MENFAQVSELGVSLSMLCVLRDGFVVLGICLFYDMSF